MVKISIVIATWNRGEKLARTLRSLAMQTLPAAEWEAVVVNNNSIDDTVAVFASFAVKHPDLNLRMVDEARQGVSWATNKGISESCGGIIAFVDDDEEVNSGFAVAYLDFFGRHPEVAFAGGKIIPLYETGRPAWMSVWTERPIAGPIDKGESEKPFGKCYPGGGNMAVRREAFERYGVFDTELGRTGGNPAGGQEKDFYRRLVAAGEPVWYVPGAVIWHIIPPEKLSLDYFRRLSRGCGASEGVRTRAVSYAAYLCALAMEACKWGATLAIALWYIVAGYPSKARYLIIMRRGITAGLLSGGRMR